MLALVVAVAIAPAFETAQAGDSHGHGHGHCLLHGNPAVLTVGASLRALADSHVPLAFDHSALRAVRVDSIFVPPRV